MSIGGPKPMCLGILGSSNDGHPRRTFQKRVLLWLCGPVSTIPGLLKVGNMSVGNKFKVTNPVYISHMIILTTADSSSLAYWLPSLLNAQCELHYFAQESVQLILDCHFSKFSTSWGVETLPGQLGPEVPEAHPAGRGDVAEGQGG